MKKNLFLLLLICCPMVAMQESADKKLDAVMLSLQQWDEKRHKYETGLKNNEKVSYSYEELKNELTDNLVDLKKIVLGSRSEVLPVNTLSCIGGFAWQLGSLSIVRALICRGVPYDHFLDLKVENQGQIEWLKEGQKNIENYIALVQFEVKSFAQNPINFEPKELTQEDLLRQIYYDVSRSGDKLKTKREQFIAVCKQLIDSGKGSEVLGILTSFKNDIDEDRIKMAQEIMDTIKVERGGPGFFDLVSIFSSLWRP